MSAIIISSGCAMQPVVQTPPLETSRILPYSKDKVWASTVKVVSQKLPIQVIEKDSGLISTQTAQLPLGYGNSGSQNYFYQPNSMVTALTSSNRLWTPGTVATTDNTIVVLPEIPDRGLLSTVHLRCYGVCSTFLNFIKRMPNEGEWY